MPDGGCRRSSGNSGLMRFRSSGTRRSTAVLPWLSAVINRRSVALSQQLLENSPGRASPDNSARRRSASFDVSKSARSDGHPFTSETLCGQTSHERIVPQPDTHTVEGASNVHDGTMCREWKTCSEAKITFLKRQTAVLRTDPFCGAGGSAMGELRRGLVTVGVVVSQRDAEELERYRREKRFRSPAAAGGAVVSAWAADRRRERRGSSLKPRAGTDAIPSRSEGFRSLKLRPVSGEVEEPRSVIFETWEEAKGEVVSVAVQESIWALLVRTFAGAPVLAMFLAWESS